MKTKTTQWPAYTLGAVKVDSDDPDWQHTCGKEEMNTECIYRNGRED